MIIATLVALAETGADAIVAHTAGADHNEAVAAMRAWFLATAIAWDNTPDDLEAEWERITQGDSDEHVVTTNALQR